MARELTVGNRIIPVIVAILVLLQEIVDTTHVGQARGAHVCNVQGRQTCCPGWKLSPLGRCFKRELSCEQLGCDHDCAVRRGSPRCTCLTGFALLHDGKTCKDVDECRELPNACQQGCVNTAGSFMCTCNPGYSLSDDGKTCRRFSDYTESLCGGSRAGKQCDDRLQALASDLFPSVAKLITTGTPPEERKQGNVPQSPLITRNEPGSSFPSFWEDLVPSPDWACPGGDCDGREILRDCIGTGCPSNPDRVPTETRRHSDTLDRKQSKDTISDRRHSNYIFGQRVEANEPETIGSTGFQGDAPRCRDDLCNDRERAKQLLDRDDQMEQTSSDVFCPDGYRTVERLGIYFCEPVELIEITDSVKAPKTSTQCTDGKVLVTHAGGEESCESVDLDLECPEGFSLMEVDGQSDCFRQQSEDIYTCPDGRAALQTSKGLLCRKPETVAKKPAPSLPDCGPGKKPVKTGPGFQFTCVDAVNTKITCPTGTIPQATKNGAECVPALKCPPGQSLVETNAGMSCRPLSSEAVCPEGLVATETSSGPICEYKAVKKKKCPSGQSEKMVNGKPVCAGIHDRKYCPPPQVAIETDSGVVCGFQSAAETADLCQPEEMWINGACAPRKQIACDSGEILINGKCLPAKNRELVCSEGEEPIKGECVRMQSGSQCPPGTHWVKNQCATYIDKSCPVGEELVMTSSGDVLCQPMTGLDPVHTGEVTPFCAEGEILTQTPKGFMCMQDGGTDKGSLPCTAGTVLVRLGTGYSCVHHSSADVLCAEGEVMIQLKDRFVCRREGETTAPELPECQIDEILVANESGQHCEPITSAETICGEGYIAVKKHDGILCRKRTSKIRCLDGFVLSLKTKSPACVPIDGPECLNENDCTDSTAGVPACQHGRVPVIDDTGITCIEELALPPCGDPFCPDGSEGCSSPEDGAVRPCDFDLEVLLAGCHPPCANGGTCNNGTCQCVAGIRGNACQTDEDECSRMSSAYCEHQCVNTFGSFHCACPDGMALNPDGRTCSQTLCIPECLNGGQCISGTCNCPSGFTGAHCEKDIDECSLYGSRLCQHRCRNTYGSYGCVCKPGTTLNADKRTCSNTTCIPACRNGGRCFEHQCFCPAGFKGIICQFDVNECTAQRPCSHLCTNTRGSYHCACPTGYRLEENGKTCQILK